jgi:hypothetical protein
LADLNELTKILLPSETTAPPPKGNVLNPAPRIHRCPRVGERLLASGGSRSTTGLSGPPDLHRRELQRPPAGRPYAFPMRGCAEDHAAKDRLAVRMTTDRWRGIMCAGVLAGGGDLGQGRRRDELLPRGKEAMQGCGQSLLRRRWAEVAALRSS